MKILYVVKNMRLANGVASYVMNYYRKLRNVPNIKMDFLIVSDVPSPYYDEIKGDGNNVYILPSYKKNLFKVIKFLKDLFNSEEYDVIHCNTVNSSSLILKIAKNYNIPVRILHSHATKNGDNLLKRLVGSFFKKIAIKNANSYFACSKYAGDSMFKEREYTIIHNAVDISKFEFNKKIRENIRKNAKVSNDSLIVMTVGRITKQKNPFFIVDIIEKIVKKEDKVIFWWFGSGDLDDKIKEYINKKSLNNKVKLFGSISNVSDYYSAADIFILPSLFEGLPVVGIEAQISGMLALFSDKITHEVKISKNCYFINIEAAELWAKMIFRFRNYDRDKNIKSIRKKEYDINFQYKNLLNKYKELLERM